jgi:hypothetical protein
MKTRVGKEKKREKKKSIEAAVSAVRKWNPGTQHANDP